MVLAQGTMVIVGADWPPPLTTMQPFAEGLAIQTRKNPATSAPSPFQGPQLNPLTNKVTGISNLPRLPANACHVHGRPLACTLAQNVAPLILITPRPVTRPANVKGQSNLVEPWLCCSDHEPVTVKLVFAGANLAAAKDGVAMAVIAEATMPA